MKSGRDPQDAGRLSTEYLAVWGVPAGSKEAAKRRTAAIRTVGPTLIKG